MASINSKLIEVIYTKEQTYATVILTDGFSFKWNNSSSMVEKFIPGIEKLRDKIWFILKEKVCFPELSNGKQSPESCKVEKLKYQVE